MRTKEQIAVYQKQWVKDNPKKCQEISNNARKFYKETYTKENLVIYWHKLLSNLNQITYE